VKIIKEHPDHRCDASVAAIDAGFDLRDTGIIAAIPATVQTVGYDHEDGPAMVTGTIEEIVQELKRAGYSVRIGRWAHENQSA
jgi:hypothetical protein